MKTRERANVWKKKYEAAQRRVDGLETALNQSQRALAQMCLERDGFAVRLDAALDAPMAHGYLRADEVAKVVTPFAQLYSGHAVSQDLLLRRFRQLPMQVLLALSSLAQRSIEVAKLDPSLVAPMAPVGPSPEQQVMEMIMGRMG